MGRDDITEDEQKQLDDLQLEYKEIRDKVESRKVSKQDNLERKHEPERINFNDLEDLEGMGCIVNRETGVAISPYEFDAV